MKPFFPILTILFLVFGDIHFSYGQSSTQFEALGGSSLFDLALPREGKAQHAGSNDPLGNNNDFRTIGVGETLPIFDFEGAGIVRRFWLTIGVNDAWSINVRRQLILRMYWDGENTPSVEVPLGDYFGVGFGEQHDFISLPLNETSGGYNSYWPMPFHKSAHWTVTNLSPVPLPQLYWNIDFTSYDALPSNMLHFHAQWRRENPTTKGDNYTILEATGSGTYVGTALFMQNRQGNDLHFLEGNEMFYIDGEAKPSINGTGTEDYFSSGYYYNHGVYSAPFHGLTIGDTQLGRISTYRWHIPDAMPFQKSFRATIQHGDVGDPSVSDYSSVAYWYQSEPHAVFPKLPDPKKLLPIVQQLYRLDTSGGSIWSWQYLSASWLQLDNNAQTTAIAAGGEDLYQRHSNGDVWHYTGISCVDAQTCLPTWQQLDFNVETAEIIADTNDLYQRHTGGDIWHYTGVPCSAPNSAPLSCPGWEQLDSNAQTTAIAAGGGALYQLHNNDNDHSIWRYTGTPCSRPANCPGWEQLDNNAQTTAIIAGGGALYQLHNDDHSIWHYTGVPCGAPSSAPLNCPGWEKLDSNVHTKAIVAAEGDLYQLHDDDGSIWRYKGIPCNGPQNCPGWDQLDNNVQTTAIVAAENQLYQLHGDGTVWRYCNGGCNDSCNGGFKGGCNGWQQLGTKYPNSAIAASLNAN